jgi:hypothetical protein
MMTAARHQLDESDVAIGFRQPGEGVVVIDGRGYVLASWVLQPA